MNWLSFVPFLAIVFAVALSGAMFMPGNWYKSLNKPHWTPPDWLFGPAWTILYVMIAIAGWLVWKADGVGAPLGIWAANLMFNAIWSWLMFKHHHIRAALADAIAMLITIVGFMTLAWPLSQTATLLFAPYLAWVTYAVALNLAILRRNPSAA